MLVTDPPNANFNHLQNPPIGQTTTLQFIAMPRLITVTHGFAQVCLIHGLILVYSKLTSQYIYPFNQLIMGIVEPFYKMGQQ